MTIRQQAEINVAVNQIMSKATYSQPGQIIPDNLMELCEEAIRLDAIRYEASQKARAAYRKAVAEYRTAKDLLEKGIARKSPVCKVAYFPTYQRKLSALFDGGYVTRKGLVHFMYEEAILKGQVEKLG